MNRSFFIAFIAIVAFTAGLSVRWLMSAPANPTVSGSRRQLAEFSLPDLSGKLRSTHEWQGKVIVINFWATWCPPCLKEMPEFVNLQNQFGSQGLQLIGIAIDEADPVRHFVDQHKINYPILLGETEGTKIAHDLGNVVNTVPFTVIVDKKGQVVKSHMGELDRETLMKIITPLL